MDNYSELMGHKWRNKAKKWKDWIKVHIVADTERHAPFVVRITRDDVGDQEIFIPLVQECIDKGYMIKCVPADGIFDIREIYNILDENSIVPGIVPRKNASRKSRWSMKRSEEVRFYQDYGV